MCVSERERAKERERERERASERERERERASANSDAVTCKRKQWYAAASANVVEVMKTFDVIAACGHEPFGAYIISMTRSASHVLEVP